MAEYSLSPAKNFADLLIEKNSVKVKYSAKLRNQLKLLKSYCAYNITIDLDTRDGILSAMNSERPSHF